MTVRVNEYDVDQARAFLIAYALHFKAQLGAKQLASGRWLVWMAHLSGMASASTGATQKQAVVELWKCLKDAPTRPAAREDGDGR